VITSRDQNALNFLSDFRIATLSQIHRIFFNDVSERYSSKRIKYLYDNGYVKRTISTINSGYAYYISKKPVQIHHDLLRAELFAQLQQRYKVLEWNNEMPVLDIRPDAFAYIEDNGIPFPVFIEIHLSNKFNFDKYKSLLQSADLKALYGIMPRVIICTDRQVDIPPMAIKFKVVAPDMKTIDTIFK
jgi:hypothetical protein